MMRKRMVVLCAVVLLMILAAPALANPSVAVPVIPMTEGVVVEALNAENPVEGFVDETAKLVVAAVNGEGYMTPAEAAEAFDADPSAVESYSFSSQFYRISAPSFPVDVEFEGTDENTRVMLINTETGEMVILTPNEDGSFTFPFGGVFALMDPTPA